jgi:hypothetical protein
MLDDRSGGKCTCVFKILFYPANGFILENGGEFGEIRIYKYFVLYNK